MITNESWVQTVFNIKDQFIALIMTIAPIAGAIVVAVIALLLLLKLILHVADVIRLIKQQSVLIELTPPDFTNKTAYTTQQLFMVLHTLDTTKPWWSKLLRQKVIVSLEIVSSRAQGIRYIVRTNESDAPFIERTIVSYLPGVKIRRVDDYLPEQLHARRLRIVEFKQAGHFAYPLQKQNLLEQHDPVAYLTGSMTQLTPEDLVGFQLVISPTYVREASTILHKVLNNEDLLLHLGKNSPFSHIGRKFLDGLSSLTFGFMEAVGDIVSSDYHYKQHQGYHQDIYHKQQVAARIKPARQLSSFEQQLVASINDKVSQPLFRASIRALVVVDDSTDRGQRVRGLRSSLAAFTVPRYQSLQAKFNIPFLFNRTRLLGFRRRLPGILTGGDCLLSAGELADLYHFPYSHTARTENIVKSLSKTLPAPISLKNGSQLDIILGQNVHNGTTTSIGLTVPERERHVYIIGGTGNGKTTMLQYAIVQDIQNGKGVAVVDPHGDLAKTILRHIPEERINDVVYFNPDDLAYPIGLNMLELPINLSSDDLLREKDLVTESVISIFRKIFSENDTGGHRIEYVLRNAIQTALTLEGSTLFTIFRLLTDATYRKKVTKTLQDEDLKNFWNSELDKAGDFQRVKMSAGITAKIGRFLFSASAKRVLEQPKSTIDFDNILNSGKILICNFSKGLLGEDSSELFGITVLAKLQMAALRRARLEQSERKPYHLYVDEFQNFATTSFVQMLSESRKYKLFLTMAEQSTSQQEEQRIVNIILANVGTIVCFRSGNPADEQLILPMFSPYVEAGEIANLPAYSFYIRLAAVKAQEPLSGKTVLLEDEGSKEIAVKAITASRATHAIEYKTPLIPHKQGKNAARTTTKSKKADKVKETKMKPRHKGTQGKSKS